MSILVVSAHPDDEILGCGSTMAKLSRQGNEVHVVIPMGLNVHDEEQTPQDIDELRSILGIQQYIRKHIGKGNHFDEVPIIKFVRFIEYHIEVIQPETIYTHSEKDLNIDHQIINRAVRIAARPLLGNPVREILAFEVLSSTEWGYESFNPNVFEDITDTIDTKIKAMECYETELRLYPHPRSIEGIRTLARMRGMTVGMEYAEGFELVWEKRV